MSNENRSVIQSEKDVAKMINHNYLKGEKITQFTKKVFLYLNKDNIDKLFTELESWTTKIRDMSLMDLMNNILEDLEDDRDDIEMIKSVLESEIESFFRNKEVNESFYVENIL